MIDHSEQCVMEAAAVKLLLVDDSDIVRTSLRNMFKDSPLVHVVGDTGEPADVQRLFDSLEPDIVVLDVHMGKANGIDIAQELRRRNPNVQIAILTNYFDPMTIQRCKAAGAEYVFDKSTEFDLFVQFVELLAERHSTGSTSL